MQHSYNSVCFSYYLLYKCRKIITYYVYKASTDNSFAKVHNPPVVFIKSAQAQSYNKNIFLLMVAALFKAL